MTAVIKAGFAQQMPLLVTPRAALLTQHHVQVPKLVRLAVDDLT